MRPTSFPTSQVVSQTVEGGLHRYGYAQARERIGRLANALVGLGIKPGDRVATLAWNGYRHFELYYAISGIGAVCHTINPRLFPEQITYIANHAEDTALFFDLDLPAAGREARARAQVRRAPTWLMTDREHMPAASLAAGSAAATKACSPRMPPAFDVARVRREHGLRALLHLRHHRRAQGRAVLQPVRRCCTRSRPSPRSRTPSRTTARSCPWCRCSTPTPGACPTSRR